MTRIVGPSRRTPDTVTDLVTVAGMLPRRDVECPARAPAFPAGPAGFESRPDSSRLPGPGQRADAAGLGWPRRSVQASGPLSLRLGDYALQVSTPYSASLSATIGPARLRPGTNTRTRTRQQHPSHDAASASWTRPQVQVTVPQAGLRSGKSVSRRPAPGPQADFVRRRAGLCSQ